MRQSLAIEFLVRDLRAERETIHAASHKYNQGSLQLSLRKLSDWLMTVEQEMKPSSPLLAELHSDIQKLIYAVTHLCLLINYLAPKMVEQAFIIHGFRINQKPLLRAIQVRDVDKLINQLFTVDQVSPEMDWAIKLISLLKAARKVEKEDYISFMAWALQKFICFYLDRASLAKLTATNSYFSKALTTEKPHLLWTRFNPPKLPYTDAGSGFVVKS